MFASGHVKLTDERGDVTYATNLELTEDFASGFADAVQVHDRRPEPAHVRRASSAPTTPSPCCSNGVYTACEPCKNHPRSAAAVAGARRARSPRTRTTHTIYFRDAYFDAFGVPVAYIPYFSVADPTVTRQSGFLAPTFVSKSYLGLGVTTPYFFALAPNYDLTLSPSFYTMQGPFLDAEWRHRTENGVVQRAADRHRPVAARQVPRPALRRRQSASSAARPRARASSTSTRTGPSAGT